MKQENGNSQFVIVGSEMGLRRLLQRSVVLREGEGGHDQVAPRPGNPRGQSETLLS